MNPRDFCSEPGFPWSVFFTYSFDPLFFERVIMRDLRRGGGAGILVIADRDEVDRALAMPGLRLRALGRSYALATCAFRSAFHPKVFLRLGKEGGMAWVGTGNVTHGGWGGNRELASAWRVGPETGDGGGWVPSLLRSAIDWTGSHLAEEFLTPALGLDWVREAAPAVDSRFLTTDTASLTSQIEDRWRGRRFTEMRVLTGSTDRAGQMIRWAQRVFGVETIRIALDPARSSFDLDGIGDLRGVLGLHPVQRPPLHAKAYWFDGPDGPAALFGSPNCSAAAWLRSSQDGGNLETAVVFDAPDPEQFATVLELFETETVALDAIVPQRRPEEEDGPARPAYSIRSLRWDEEGDRIDLEFTDPAPPPDATVELALQDRVIPLQRGNDVWTGRLQPGEAIDRTILVHAFIRTGIGVVQTNPHWIDIPTLLRDTLVGRRHAVSLLDLKRSGSDRDDDRQLQALTRLAQDLLSDSTSFADPARAFAPRDKTPAAAEARRIQPEDLARALDGNVIAVQHRIETASGLALGINGIFKALFADDAERDADDSAETLDDASNADGSAGENLPPEPALEKPVRTVAAKYRKRFENHLDRFIAELQDPAFASRCTAAQLRQAIAYPVAAAVLGQRRHWAEPERAAAWIKASVGVLLYEHDRRDPLLAAVRARYEPDRLDLFNDAVGDGVLWVTLASAVVNAHWPGPEGALHRIVLLADLWNSPLVRADLDPARLAELARRYNAENAVSAIQEMGAPAASVMSSLVTRLRSLPPAADARNPVTKDSILWNRKVGWGIATEDEKNGKALLYAIQVGEAKKFDVAWWVSLDDAASRDPEAAELRATLLEVMAGLMNTEGQREIQGLSPALVP